jgi:uncharacterized repeat protein (TIGR01451 family)
VIPGTPECSDFINNDPQEDVAIDEQDPGCHSDNDPNNAGSYNPNDDSELDTPGPGQSQCSNNIDDPDPEDDLIDEADPGCHTDRNPNNPNSYNALDNNEQNDVVEPQCSNGVDDEDPEDTLVDANDPGCHTDGNATDGDATYDAQDNNERNSTGPGPGPGPEGPPGDETCGDGIDNDGDGLFDGEDPDCQGRKPLTNLVLEMTASKSRINLHRLVAFTITVRNLGPDVANNVNVRVILGHNMKFRDVTGNGCINPAPFGNEVHCLIPQMSPGGNTVVMTVLASGRKIGRTPTFAEVTSALSTELAPSDNKDEARVKVQQRGARRGR